MKHKSIFIIVLLLCAVVATAQEQYNFVDLGLPSGTLWADRNLGASSPEDYGDYFAWGETSPKSNYDWSTYKYANGDKKKLTKYCSQSKYGDNGYTDRLTILEGPDDAATANWGSDWCTPTQAQFQELMDLCPWFWTTQNGKNGIYVRGRNGNSIFIPAAGVHTGADLKSAGASGLYWLSSFNESRPGNGCEFYFNSNGVSTNYYDYRFNGSSIRPVRRK